MREGGREGVRKGGREGGSERVVKKGRITGAQTHVLR